MQRLDLVCDAERFTLPNHQSQASREECAEFHGGFGDAAKRLRGSVASTISSLTGPRFQSMLHLRDQIRRVLEEVRLGSCSWARGGRNCRSGST